MAPLNPKLLEEFVNSGTQVVYFLFIQMYSKGAVLFMLKVSAQVMMHFPSPGRNIQELSG